MPSDIGINAGELRHSVVIQGQSTAPDSVTGSPSMAWTAIRSTKAKIATSTSREVYLASQFASQVTHMVTLRWSPTPISAGMRIMFGNRFFVIQAIENVLEQNVKLNLMCLEIDGVTS